MKSQALESKKIWAYYPLLFLTGSVTLSLEVLSSRIMTPYFGASLYIWASILSVTLTFLAIGYGVGGWLTRWIKRDRILILFLSAPCFAALMCALAAFSYPFLFPWLAAQGLILGSFFAAVFILAVPLSVLSAMTPLLVSVDCEPQPHGDGGAGTALFVGTFGAVFGVLMTVFVFIPHLANHSVLLILAIAQCTTVIMTLLWTVDAPKMMRRTLLIIAAVIVLLCGVFLGGRDTYLEWLDASESNPQGLHVVAEYPSAFGSIKILNNAAKEVLYVQDGMLHNHVDQAGKSLLPYIHILARLGLTHMPKAKSAMVLGLAGGSIPRQLADRGLEVTVVEIDPRSVQAAERHFGFDASKLTVHIEDARTYVRRCSQPVDLVVVDLFYGDGTPQHLLSQEFFFDLKRCLKPGGVVVINILLPSDNLTPSKLMASTLRAVFPHLAVYDDPNPKNKTIRQAYFVARTTPLPLMAMADLSNLSPRVKQHVSAVLQNGRIVADNEFSNTAPVQDAFNVYGVVNAQTHINFRRFLVRQLPPRMLVN